MFTGIVSDTGKVLNITRKNRSYYLEIACDKACRGVDIGDSVAVNGVCLSVVSMKGPLCFDVVDNTLSNTNLKRLKRGSIVNLENALKMGDDISGHMVSGHVDGERKIRQNRNTSDGWVLDVAYENTDSKYIIPKGSVAIDGISLTVGDILRETFRIYLIPHTLNNTTLISKKSGDFVNVEYDMNAKYSENRKNNSSEVTRETLARNGFL